MASDAAYSKAVAELRGVHAALKAGGKDKDYDDIAAMRDKVLAKYRPIFSLGHISKLTRDEYVSFLHAKNNHHWSGLDRKGQSVARDLQKLREALALLLDESTPIRDRLPASLEMLGDFGRATATAILTVAYPDKYGVLNGTSEKALKKLGLWPKFERGEGFGNQYEKLNSLYGKLCAELGIDFWTLDSLWWVLRKQGRLAVSAPGGKAGLALKSQDSPMSSWLFQGNPDTFDIDTYLSAASTFVWSVNQEYLAAEMRVGDEVFLWRAAGSMHAISGVVALAEVVEPPAKQLDDPKAVALWRVPGRNDRRMRVRLRMVRYLTPETMVGAEKLANDPVLSKLTVFRMRNQTNYRLSSAESETLLALVQDAGSAGAATPSASAIGRTAYADFGEAPDDDPDQLQNFARKVRRGQPMFRRKLLRLYSEQCAVSGWGPEAVLEAAHISSHAEAGLNRSDNGLLLRADLHELFDAGLLRIHPDTLRVSLSPTLKGTPYWSLSGKTLRRRADGSAPSRKFLRRRWKK
jgi:predicted RNA-binding protein with PUA-like domain